MLTVIFASVQIADAQHYQGDISVAYGIGVGDPNFNGWNIQTVHGYRFNDHLFLGGGVGLIKYSDISDSVIPVFANVRGYLRNNRRVNPFTSFDLGYGFREDGGMYFSPSVGIQIYAYSMLGFFAAVGYQYAVMYDTSLDNINIRVGFQF